MSDPLEQDRLSYEATGNPLYVLGALASASLDRKAPPLWIMDCMVQWAKALFRGEDDGPTCRLPNGPKTVARPTPTAGAMCSAFGLVQGKKNAFAGMSKDNDDVWIAITHRLLGGDDKAARRLAIANGAKSEKQVQSAMQNIRRATERSKLARRSID